MILKVTLVYCAAALAATLLRRSSAAVRHSIWMSAIGASLLIPAAPTLFTPVDVATPRFVLAANALAAPALPASANWLLYLWAAGALAMALRFAVGHWRTWRVVAESQPVAALDGADIRRAPAGVPALTWGIVRPTILVGEADAESILHHELAHARRHDHLSLLLTQAACTLFWFHPLAWYAARQAAAEREQACDDAVLSAGVAPTQYAETLVDAARATMAVPTAALAATATPLESRIRAILNPHVDRSPARRGIVAAALCLALVAAYPIAAQQIHKVGNGVTAPRLKTKVEPRYTDSARQEKISGKVVLYVEVDEEGLARNIRVLEPLDAGLDANAITAVEQWTFEPGTKEGKPVRVAATIEVNYRLE